MRGGEGKWRTGGRLARSRLAKTTTVDLRCNDSKARQEGHRISLEDLEDLGVHRTNQVVLKDSKVRQEEDLQINQEDHKTNQEDRQTNQGGRLVNQEDRQTKEDLPPKRWIRIRVTLTTKHLPRKAKRLRKENLRPRASRLRKGNRPQEKENHHQRGSRALQMEQAVIMTMTGLAGGLPRWRTPCRMGGSTRQRWRRRRRQLRRGRCWAKGLG